MVSRVMCDIWLYRLMIFAFFHTLRDAKGNQYYEIELDVIKNISSK